MTFVMDLAHHGVSVSLSHARDKTKHIFVKKNFFSSKQIIFLCFTLVFGLNPKLLVYELNGQSRDIFKYPFKQKLHGF